MTEALRTADRRARVAAQREFVAPLVLEAGAGTGKTTTLVARILTWCLGPGWDHHESVTESTGTAPSKSIRDAGAETGRDTIATRVLGGVVAITFTEAAAAEMAQRVGTEMARVGQGEFPPWLWRDPLPETEECRLRARALTAALDHLVVRTIHAFCRSLLAANPLEAGLHPVLEVDADGSALEQVAREVVEEHLQSAYGEPGDRSYLKLAALGVGPEDLVEALIRLAQEGAQPRLFEADPLSPREVSRLLDRLSTAIEPFTSHLGPTLRTTSKRSKLTFQVLEALELTQTTLQGQKSSQSAESSTETGIEAFCQTLSELWKGSPLQRLRDWGQGKINASEAAALGEVTTDLQARSSPLADLLAHVTRLQPALLAHGRKVLNPLLHEVRRLLRARGIVTFTDLLFEARDLLASREGVRRQIRRSMDQLLVDEFQDTDPTQCDLVRWLGLDGPQEERPGLFLVGDPKQSIYGWRSADLEAYHGFVTEVLRAGGQQHLLSENFRSVPAILQEVERCVAPIMEEEVGVQPSFQPLLPCPHLQHHSGFRHPGPSTAPRTGTSSESSADPRSTPSANWHPVEYWVSWNREDDSGRHRARTRSLEAAHLEASAVARDLLRLRQEHQVQWKDVALLLRSTGNLDVYLDALRQAAIPFEVGRDKQYYRRREIIEAAALVRSVLDPGDQLALVTLLRSPMVGVPDAALIPLWSRHLPELMMELDLPALKRVAQETAQALPGEIPGLAEIRGWESNLVTAGEHLVRLRAAYRTAPAAEFVDLLRRLSFQEVLESGRYLGRYRLANLHRFFRQLEAALEAGSDVPGLLRLLRRAVATSEDAAEARPGGNAEAVQVMTIHGAKGLGFEHVYLLELHKKDPPRRAPGTAFRQLPNGVEYSLFGATSLGFDRVLTAQRAVEQAERVRLLYVAMTRAKKRLVMAGSWPQARSEIFGREAASKARTLLDLLTSRSPAPPALDELLDASEDPGPSEPIQAEEAGASWIFLPSEKPMDAAAQPVALPLPTPEAVASASSELLNSRREAQLHMSRPWNGAASQGAHGQLEETPVGSTVNRDTATDGRDDSSEAVDRNTAMAIGTAVHRALETIDLEAEPANSFSQQLRILPSVLAPLLPSTSLPAAEEKAKTLLQQFFAGPLLELLRDLAPHLLARELPILLPGSIHQTSSEGYDSPAASAQVSKAPVKFVSGTIDLLYSDPLTEEVVIVDYKTDDIHSPRELENRVAAYRQQGEVYRRAVQGALDLPDPPRFELWFLTLGQVEIILP
ncbi:MAG: UvrD-helicase domain-containing protein [Deltaproteobacteria bacterium]|nr:UvrD-helicase domain-containing protein [Deltaproteobacteria bacterium]